MRTMLILLLAIIAGAALAVSPDEALEDPALEARARALGAELRCITCQSQSIEDSDAPLATDIRKIVREQIMAGKTDAEITDYLVDRYGDYVRLRPRLSGGTLILWAAPFVVLLIGGVMATTYFRSMQKHRPAEHDEADDT